MKLTSQEINRLEGMLMAMENSITDKLKEVIENKVQSNYIYHTIQLKFLDWVQTTRVTMQSDDASFLGIFTEVRDWERRVRYVLSQVEFAGEWRTFVTSDNHLRMVTDPQRFIDDHKLNVVHKHEDGTIVTYAEKSDDIQKNLVASGIVGKKIYGPAIVQSQVLATTKSQGLVVTYGVSVFNQPDNQQRETK